MATQDITVDDITLTVYPDGTVELSRDGEHLATLDPAEFEALAIAAARVQAMPACEDCEAQVGAVKCRRQYRSGAVAYLPLCHGCLRKRSDAGQNIRVVAP